MHKRKAPFLPLRPDRHKSAFTACPACGKQVPLTTINVHLDTSCNPSAQQLRPALRHCKTTALVCDAPSSTFSAAEVVAVVAPAASLQGSGDRSNAASDRPAARATQSTPLAPAGSSVRCSPSAGLSEVTHSTNNLCTPPHPPPSKSQVEPESDCTGSSSANALPGPPSQLLPALQCNRPQQAHHPPGNLLDLRLRPQVAGEQATVQSAGIHHPPPPRQERVSIKLPADMAYLQSSTGAATSEREAGTALQAAETALHTAATPAASAAAPEAARGDGGLQPHPPRSAAATTHVHPRPLAAPEPANGVGGMQLHPPTTVTAMPHEQPTPPAAGPVMRTAQPKSINAFSALMAGSRTVAAAAAALPPPTRLFSPQEVELVGGQAHAHLSGQYLFRNFISEAEEAELLQMLDHTPPAWADRKLNGWYRAKLFGVRSDYTTRTVKSAVTPMPNAFMRLAERMRGLPPSQHFHPNEANALDYRRGVHHLVAHHDDRYMSTDIICNLSLAGEAVMTFHRAAGKLPADTVRVHLPPRCLQLLTRDARYTYSHQIDGADILSERRVSITFRHSPLRG